MPKLTDNFDIIFNDLNSYGGRQKTANDWRMVQCAFHEDGTPSMGVYMRIDGFRKLGDFNCLGCGAHGTWNEFAEKVGLTQIKEWNSKESHVGSVVTQELDDHLLGDSNLTLKSILRLMGSKDAQPWPESMDWRGIPGWLISDLGGRITQDDFNNNVAVLFPIKAASKYVGAVKAIYKKKYSSQLGYLTMRGEWVRKYGLFPYHYTKKLIEENGYNFVILVEGPRDALRLLKLGIPALAILGSQNFSLSKVIYLKSLDIDIVYALPDNDKAGDAMWQTVKALCTKKRVASKLLKLPKEKDENGKLIKMDPFSAPRDVVLNLKDYLRSNNNWVKGFTRVTI